MNTKCTATHLEFQAFGRRRVTGLRQLRERPVPDPPG